MTWFAQRMTFLQSPWGKWSVYMGNMEKKQLVMTYSCLTRKSTKCGVRPTTRVANSPAGAAWVTWKAPARGMRRKNTFKSCCYIWTGSQSGIHQNQKPPYFGTTAIKQRGRLTRETTLPCIMKNYALSPHTAAANSKQLQGNKAKGVHGQFSSISPLWRRAANDKGNQPQSRAHEWEVDQESYGFSAECGSGWMRNRHGNGLRLCWMGMKQSQGWSIPQSQDGVKHNLAQQ